VIEIVAGVVDVITVRVIDENGVAGKPDLAARAGIPEGVEPIHDEGPTIEQIDLRIRHRFRPSIQAAAQWRKDPPTATGSPAAVTPCEQSTAAILVVNQFPLKRWEKEQAR
jgi:hypothetical protein